MFSEETNISRTNINKLISVKYYIVMKNILNKKTGYLVLVLIGLVLLLSGCADVSPHVSTCITSDPYGFWGGLWHGMVLPFSWIGSLFSDDIAIYAYDNNGGWYDFGFILGVCGLGFGSGSKSKM